MFTGLASNTRRKLARDYAHALRAFGPVKQGARMLIDRILMLTPILPHLHTAIPQAPVIMVLRDPRDVCLSFYMQVMAMWLKIRKYQCPQFFEIKYEDFVQSTELTYQKIIQHLGVSQQPLDITPIQPTETSVIMTPSYEAVTRPINTKAIGRWRNYSAHFAKAEEILAPAIEAFSYD